LKLNLQVILQVTCEYPQIPVGIPVSYRCRYDIFVLFAGESAGICRAPASMLCLNPRSIYRRFSKANDRLEDFLVDQILHVRPRCSRDIWSLNLSLGPSHWQTVCSET
jgi:hypothetical protein